ncbi:hypothetical protein DEU56DRAFT_823053 [Suillus clintonianus]|uniref:uncharacterized protein n=1 Tax=Suillus clintonianus TaxID=1904413 RepID=UPI001B8662BB|nr:uncharacterized protein DEU56DRAFT_823053 [Suillus clintonianus]KAG2126240.1 hypothetical protein DEU56DRAFT_823053 [Suillus clintonianus]
MSCGGMSIQPIDQPFDLEDDNSLTERHRFHNLDSVALSPKQNLLACADDDSIAKLWDPLFRQPQPLGQPFSQQFSQPFSQDDRKTLLCVSFSQDGRYIAYGGYDNKVTLWMVNEIAPELPAPPPSCLEADATQFLTEEGGDDPYSDFFQSSQPYRPSAPSGPSRRFQGLYPSSARRLWNLLIPSRHRLTASGSIGLQQRPKRSHTSPQPVTVSAGRKTKRVYIARPPAKNDAQASQSSSSTAQPVAQPHPTPQPQSHHQVQTATQQPQEEDYGCWGNFCLALWCIPRRTRPAVSAAQPAAS